MRRLLTLFLLAAISTAAQYTVPQHTGAAGGGGGGGTPSFVAATGGQDLTGTSLATLATSGTLNVQVSDIVIVFCGKDTGGTGASQKPSDTAGNTWTRSINNITASTVSSGWSSVIGTANASDTISCNYSPSQTFPAVIAVQLRTVSTLDVALGSLCNSTCTTTQTSGSFTTTTAVEAMVDCHYINGTVGWTVGGMGSTSGVYAINSSNATTGTNNTAVCQYAIFSTIQTTQTATMTAGAGAATWSSAVMSFH